MAWPNGSRLKTFLAGGSFLPADANAIEDRMLQIAGYRGKSIIATEESRSNVAYGLMATPDRVSNVVLPADGLIVIGFQALVKSSVNNAGRIAVFLNSDQLRVASSAGAPAVQEASTFGTDAYTGISSAGFGVGLSTTGVTSEVTTGQAIAAGQNSQSGVCHIFAAAGTYDVSIQCKATSGSVTMKNRHLWVWTEAFA